MLRPEQKSAIVGKSLSKLRSTWASIAGSILLFGMVLQIVRSPGGEVGALIVPLYAVAVVLGALSIAMRFISFPRTGPQTPVEDDEARALQIFRSIQMKSVLGFALAEAVSLVGLMLSFMSGDSSHFFILGGSALALMIVVHFPSRAALEDALAKFG